MTGVRNDIKTKWLVSLALCACAFVGTRLARAQELDETWTVSVNGQTVQVNPDGSFVIPNIPAPDNFGPEGPGSAPDFLSDDFLVVTGFSKAGGITRYVASEPFQITAGESFNIGDLIVSETPFPFPESIRVVAELDEVLVGATTQLTVTGVRLDGSEFDVTPRKTGTVYRTSNPSIASIGPDGLVTGHRRGTIFVTAVNLSATAVLRIDVISQLVTTNVEGFIQLEDGTPVDGAQVTLAKFGGSTLSGADGFFSLSADVPVEATLRLSVSATVKGQVVTGSAEGLPVVPDGVTDAGIIVLQGGPVLEVPDIFFDNPTYDVGNTPFALASADLDRNGAQDVVIVNQGANTVSVLLNAGGGDMTEATNYSVAADPTDVAIGDLDGDTDMDVAVASGDCCSPGLVTILLNNGDGTFDDTLTPIATAASSSSIVIGNLDGDTDLDIVTGNEANSTISLLFNNGDATFSAQVPVATTVRPGGLQLGNLDGQPGADLVVSSGPSSGYEVFLNDGNGVLSGQGFVSESSFLVDLVLADADGDTDLDIAYTTFPSNVKWFLNNGDATFTAGPSRDLGGPSTAYRLAAGDIDNDNDDDLALSSFNTSVTLTFNTGDGTLSNDLKVGAGLPRRVGLVDLDGDLDLDLAVIASAQPQVGFVRNTGDAAAPAFGPPGFATGFSNSSGCVNHSVTIGQWDADGVLDVAAVSCGGSSVSVLLGNGDGSFGTRVQHALPGKGRSVTSGDLDGQNGVDLVVANGDPGRVSVLLNNGSGAFVAATSVDVANGPRSVAVGHLNNDTNLDVAVAGFETVSVLFGNGDGTLRAAVPLAVDDAWRVAIAPVNADTVNDLVIGKRQNPQLAVLLNNGDETFAPALEFTFPAFIQGIEDMTVGDVNGDGDIDVCFVRRGVVTVTLGNGDGTFTPGNMNDVGSVVLSSIGIGDISGDGLTDVVAGILSTHQTALLLGNGDGTFTLDRAFASGLSPTDLVVGDLDNNGALDIAVSNNPIGADPDSAVSVLLNRRTP